MMGFLLTLAIWGATGVIIGLFLAGIGVVPVAMLATLFHGMWEPLIQLVLLFILTFGTRMGSLYLLGSLES
jgi:hypothetical protein